MTAFADKLKAYRLSEKMTLDELAEKLSTSKQVLSRYENGIRIPKITTVHEYTTKLGLPLAALLPDDTEGVTDDFPLPSNIIPMPRMVKVPLLGTIACGDPIMAIEEPDEYVGMPEGIRGDFALKCKGDSMIGAHIYDGDIVFIRQQDDVRNGEIAAVLYNAESEATLKRIYKIPGLNGEIAMVELRAENPTIPSRIIAGEELNNLRIMGKAINYLGKVR